MRTLKQVCSVILLFSTTVAQAGPADLITTQFSGTGVVSTNLTAVGNQNLPWVDSNSRSYSGGGTFAAIWNGFGWDNYETFTISNLGANIYKVGFTVGASGFDKTITGVSLSNGDTWSGTEVVNPGGFIGWSSSTPFTSITVSQSVSLTSYLSDFRTSTVPEPSTIVTSVICMMCVGILAFRKYRKRHAALA